MINQKNLLRLDEGREEISTLLPEMTIDTNDKATTTLSRGAKTSTLEEECCKCPPKKNISTEIEEDSTESDEETTPFDIDLSDNSTMKNRGGKTSFGDIDAEIDSVESPNTVEKDVDTTTEADGIDADSRKFENLISCFNSAF